jgi:hypothetical protein
VATDEDAVELVKRSSMFGDEAIRGIREGREARDVVICQQRPGSVLRELEDSKDGASAGGDGPVRLNELRRALEMASRNVPEPLGGPLVRFILDEVSRDALPAPYPPPAERAVAVEDEQRSIDALEYIVTAVQGARVSSFAAPVLASS